MKMPKKCSIVIYNNCVFSASETPPPKEKKNPLTSLLNLISIMVIWVVKVFSFP